MSDLTDERLAEMQTKYVFGGGEPPMPTHNIPENLPEVELGAKEAAVSARIGRRDFLKVSAASAAAAVVAMFDENTADGADKPKFKLNVNVVDYKPLIAQQLDETPEQYAQRYQAHFNHHINGYLRSAQNALVNHNAFPLCQEDVPNYARCINPVGKPISGSKFSLPTILLGNAQINPTTHKMEYPQDITGEVTQNGMVLEITLKKDGANFQLFGGMDGCMAAIRNAGSNVNGQWKPFPVGDAAQQKLKLPAGGGKKGDKIFIAIPKEVILKSMGQLQVYDQQQELIRRQQQQLRQQGLIP